MGCCSAAPASARWLGALLVTKAREQISAEQAFLLCAMSRGSMVLVSGSAASRVTAGAMVSPGGVNMLTIALINVSVQLSVPRWVAARAIAGYQSSLTGGIALGAWLWGHMAAQLEHRAAYLAPGSR